MYCFLFEEAFIKASDKQILAKELNSENSTDPEAINCFKVWFDCS
jgi:hypothetical protein